MLVTMSNKELHRLPVIQAVIEKRLRRRDAASQLDLTERQVQRLMNRYRESGAAGLTDARRGRPGTHRIDERLRHRILTLLRENYVGFGPTLAAEKLQERHGIDKRLTSPSLPEPNPVLAQTSKCDIRNREFRVTLASPKDIYCFRFYHCG
mgnify:CR=1 FL=1